MNGHRSLTAGVGMRLPCGSTSATTQPRKPHCGWICSPGNSRIRLARRESSWPEGEPSAPRRVVAALVLPLSLVRVQTAPVRMMTRMTGPRVSPSSSLGNWRGGSSCSCLYYFRNLVSTHPSEFLYMT